MAAVEHVAESKDNILYDLTLYTEWPLETESVLKISKDKQQVSVAGKLSSLAQRSIWTFLRSLGISARIESPCTLASGLVKLINVQLPWQLEVCSNGECVAVLQDNCIEIRSAHDEYSTIVCRCTVGKDPYPQWRKLKWSPDSLMIAYSDSRGNVQVYDIMGVLLLEISSQTSKSVRHVSDLSSAVAGLIFTDHKDQEEHWHFELLVVNFQGFLRKYLISNTGEYRFEHQFFLGTHYPKGVSCVVYLPQHNLLMVGGNSTSHGEQSVSSATSHGITAWRCLSGSPYYKLVWSLEDEKLQAEKKQSFFRRFRILNWRNQLEDGVYKMSLSPDGQTLAAVHFSGRLSLWQVPSLRDKREWELGDQPGVESNNPVISEDPKKRKHVKEYCVLPTVSDISWWSSEALIIARCHGAVSVSSADTLRNLLGSSPEWFEPLPQISPAHNGAFVGLECGSVYSSLKRHLVGAGDDDGAEESDDDDDLTAVTRTTRLVKRLLYYATDMERFQPPRKRPKLVKRTYRLVSLKSTTPEELYTRKIDNEEYGEALALAKSYGLDSDKVYQKQWRKSQVSVASIQDYLRKIKKRSWVLHECLERVPENIDAMRELLNYGLRGTDLEALTSIGERTDHGHFILCDTFHELDDSFNEEDSKEKFKERQQKLFSECDFQNLTLEQRELCKIRQKLLRYLDRLSTYEAILGGPHAAEERFDHKFYQKLRSQNIVQAAVDYARAGDVNALFYLFTYHGSDLLHNKLAILANFPETMSPFDYRELLPEVINSEVVAWPEDKWRAEDWVESDTCQLAINPNPVDLGLFLYEDDPALEKFRTHDPDLEVVSRWYARRACEIEEFAQQVDNAVELIKLGQERDVPGLEVIYSDLVAMESMVYEGNNPVTLTFAQFQEMSQLEKLQALMSASSEEMFTKNLHRWFVPFLNRTEDNGIGNSSDLIRQYLTSLAVDDLTLCFKVIEASKATVTKKVIKDENQLMSVAMECIYLCQRTDQLGFAFSILECLPQKGFGLVTETSSRLHDQVDTLENHLSAAEILEKNNISRPVSFLKDNQHSVTASRNLLVCLCRAAGRREPPPTSIEWKQLLTDIRELQAKVFKCVTVQDCYEIFAESLLCSGNHDNIKLAGEMLCRSKDVVRQKRPSGTQAVTQHEIPYERAAFLVLSAAKEYLNSSANLQDPCMEMAKTCLDLMTDVSPELQEEMDLITSLDYLHDFDVKVLPVQVRLSTNRIQLIKTALETNAKAYKKHEKLVKLGNLLHMGSHSDVEGSVLVLVTQAALKNADYKMAYRHCETLMSANYAPAWTVCKELADQEAFRDISAKIDLLCFASTFCHPDMILDILKERFVLESMIIQEQCTTESLNASEMTDVSKVGMLSSKLNISSWLKKTIEKFTHRGEEKVADQYETQRLHPFYESLGNGEFVDKTSELYSHCMETRGDSECDMMLRSAKLTEDGSLGDQQQDCSKLFMQCAMDIFPHDTLLGLSYLLALSDSSLVDDYFAQLPHTEITIQLRAYYYALQITHWIQSGLKECIPDSYFVTEPMSVVSETLSQASGHTSKEVEKLLPWLQHYYQLDTDFSQALVLRHYGKNVDVTRFSKDEDYKHGMILDLARTTDEDIYQVALQLADLYHVPPSSVHLAHVTFLLAHSRLSTVEVEKRINSLNILDSLHSIADKFCLAMVNDVYPEIPGIDHARLLYFFSLLEGSTSQPIGGLSPETQVKLLKKIKPALPGLDYKMLIDSTHNPVDVLRPVLKSANVHVVAKLAPKIPIQSSAEKTKFLQPSAVYCAWAQKLFWEGDQGSRNTPEGPSGWIHRYESCGEFLAKLLPVHLLQFLEGITFTDVAVRELALDSRCEFVRRALKFCRQQVGKRKKLEDSGEEITWDIVAESLQGMLDHLAKMTQEIFIAMRESDSTDIVKYSYQFDLSRSQQDKLESLYMKMILAGQGPDMINDLLDVFPLNEFTCKSLIQHTVNCVLNNMRIPEAKQEPGADCDDVEKLENILREIHNHQDAEGDLIQMDDILCETKDFCADLSVAVSRRLEVLHVLEKYVDLSTEDKALVVLLETQASVSAVWPEQQVDPADLRDAQSKQLLVFRLLEMSSSLVQYETVSSVVFQWLKRGSVSGEFVDKEMMQIMVAMATSESADCVTNVLALNGRLQQMSPLSKQSTEAVFRTLLTNQHPVEAIKFVLTTNHKQLYRMATMELASQEEAIGDMELCMMLLQRRLLPDIVNTQQYSPTVELLLSKQTKQGLPEDYLHVETVAEQLQNAGLSKEANELLERYQPGQKTLKAAVGMFKSWFSK